MDKNDQNNLDIQTSENRVDTQQDKLSESSVADDGVFDLKDKKIIQLEIELMQLKEQERDNILRLQAEIENIRRRSTQEIEKIHKFSLERFVFELLPVIDNLERTLGIADRSNTLLSSIIEGIELILKLFLDVMHKFGVEVVNAVHVTFNPEIHQAISMVESEEYTPNQVLTIIQKGYVLNGRLIRPAMVTVSKDKC